VATRNVVIDRSREEQLLEAALAAGAHVVLEGPPGTGKSTLLREVASRRHTAFVLVEGNAELTPARLLGHFDPALALAHGYRPDGYVDGPLLTAMRTGGLLYLEELNRVPEETLNVLITAMSEREVTVPRLGCIAAADGFAVVAAMNPYDAVGTARVSGAVHDRTCRIAMGYQTESAERRIVATQAGIADDDWCAAAVTLVRRTREHPDLRIGSSVRGAIDLARITGELAKARGVPPDDWASGLDAALLSLSGRVRLHEASTRTPEEIVTALYTEVFGPTAAVEDGEADGPGER
jgi:MoxR-like ATPase